MSQTITSLPRRIWAFLTAMVIMLGVLVSGFSFVIGLFLGLYSGYYPKFGAVVMRFCDAVKACLLYTSPSPRD